MANFFGSGLSDCPTGIVESLTSVSQAELFFPVYGAFLASIIAVLRERRAIITVILIATLIVTLASDIAETTA
jgi:hypothetical protein